MNLRLQDFDYNLPKELIAQEPLRERDGSRLLALNKNSGIIEHRGFADLLEYLEPGDLMVFNDTKVAATRLVGRRPTGGSVEALLLSRIDGNHWRAMVKPGRRVPVGSALIFGEGDLIATPVERFDDGQRILEFSGNGKCDQLIEKYGETPLPPYINKRLDDRERYQTVYAEIDGSVAAPTAGLHFTPRLMDLIHSRKIETTFVTLHVGIGTFRPVRVDDVTEHEMHSELAHLTEESCEKINRCSGRIVCVGTTTARALESAAVGKRRVEPICQETRLFITPGYDFKIIDALVTNFHMPRSTLLILVSAFAGSESIRNAYQCAIEENYRFLSFGDAMFIH